MKKTLTTGQSASLVRPKFFTCLTLAALLHVSAAYADVLRIGVLNDQSGPYADFGGVWSVVAARMAAQDFGGEVLGRKIEILSADHQNKVELGAAIARRWFDLDQVEAIADFNNSAVNLAVNSLAHERGKITLGSGSFSTRLSNDACTPISFQWTFDTYAASVGTARGVLEDGGKDWFVLAVDYAFGAQAAADLVKTVIAGGGRVMGQVKHPLNSSDFASFLLQAQASKAQVIGLANAGADTINIVKQAAEFGLSSMGQRLVALGSAISDIHAMGLEQAQGLTLTTAYYWDRDDASRAFSQRFEALTQRKPSMVQAGVYSAVSHYLKAIQAAGTIKAEVVAEKMRELPVNDFFAQNGVVRKDGRMAHDMYLVQVKTPEESKAPWDYYKVLRTLPADLVTMPLSESACPFVKQGKV